MYKKTGEISCTQYFANYRQPSMSMGFYTLPAGSRDGQQPHQEDEVYYILRGSAQLQVDGVDQPVTSGSIVFVGARVPHHFHSIEEELVTLVFFAPAESE